MESEDYADMAFICEGQKFSVHKAVMCSVSPEVKRRIDSSMRAGEAGEIEHTEFDAKTVWRMISYAYTQTYDVGGETELFSSNQETPAIGKSVEGRAMISVNNILMAHALMNAIGDYYNIPTLTALSTERFIAASARAFRTEGLIDLAKTVYYRGDATLQQALRDHFLRNSEELIQDDEVMKALAENEGVQQLALNLFREVVRSARWEKRTHKAQMKSKESQIADDKQKIEALERQQNSAQTDATSKLKRAEERCSHLEAVMMDLIDKMKGLPSECRNARCDREFSKLRFERKGDANYGAGEGEWMVKCRCGSWLSR